MQHRLVSGDGWQADVFQLQHDRLQESEARLFLPQGRTSMYEDREWGSLQPGAPTERLHALTRLAYVIKGACRRACS